MILREPGQTPYDLNFSLLGFQCRVHPAFFILPVLFSQGFIGQFDVNPGVGVLIVAAVFFISILVHELGHTLAFRYFGIESYVVLYWMGGLAIPGGGMGSWKGGRTRSLKPNEQIIVSLAGPVAGLLLALLFTIIAFVICMNPELENFGLGVFWAGPFPIPTYDISGTIFADSLTLHMFFRVAIFINIFLNIFNLLPVYPLDGGQIARQIFMQVDPWGGVRKSIILSMCISVFIALYALSKQDSFLGLFFGYMAYTNYQSLMHDTGGRKPW